MADEIVDALLIRTEFDESGLDASARAQLEAVRAFATEVGRIGRSIPPIDIDTSRLRASLAAGGNDVGAFFGGVTAQVDAGLRDLAGAIGLTDQSLQHLRAGLRAGIAEELQAFGLSAAQARRAAAGLADLPSPRFDVRALVSSGEQLRRGLLPVGPVITDTRRLLATTIAVPPLGVGPLLESSRAVVAGLLPVRTAIEDTRRLLANPIAAQAVASLTAAETQGSAQAQRYGQAQRQVAESILQGVAASTRATQAFQQLTAAQVQQGIAAVRATTRAQGQAQATIALQQQTAQTQRLAAAQAQAASQTAAVGTATAQTTRQVQALATAQQAAGTAFVGSARGADRLRGGLTALAVQASGTSPAIAQVVSGLLLLGAGSIAVTAAAAGIAAVAAAYRFLTADARAAREQNERLRDSLASRVQSALPETVQLSRELVAAEQARSQAARELQQIEFLNAQVAGGLVATLLRQLEARRLIRVVAAETQNIEAGGPLLTRARAQEIERVNAAIRAATSQGAQDELAATQAANAAHQQANEQRFQLGLQGLTAYYDQRVGLTQEATAAELAALEVRRRAIAETPIITAGASAREIQEQRINRTAELAHLDRVIALARQQSTLTQQRIRDEQTLAQLRLLQDTQIFAVPSLQAEIQLKPRIDASEILAALEASQRAFSQGVLDDEFEASRVTAEELVTAIQDVNRGLDRVAGAAVNVGLIGEQAARSIGQVQDLADAIGQVALSASTGNILGLIGAGINLIGGLFGGGTSAAEQAILDNTRALRENTIRRVEGFEGIGGGAQAAAIIQQLLATDRGRSLAEQTQAPGSAGRAIRQALVDELAELGLTFEQLQRVADDFGIQVLANGRLVGGALEQLAQEIEAATAATLRFRDTFDEQRQFLELRSRLAGEPQDPGAEFRRALEALGRIPTGIDDLFRGVDPGNQDALRTVLLDLLTRFEQGQLSAAELGGLTRDEFLRFLELGAAALDVFKDGLDKASASALNVPTGFRIALARFQASDPSPIPPPGFDPRSRPRFDTALPPTGTLPALRHADVALLAQVTAQRVRREPARVIQSFRGATFEFNLPSTVQDGAALYHDFRRRVEDAALSTTGDVADRGGVL